MQRIFFIFSILDNWIFEFLLEPSFDREGGGENSHSMCDTNEMSNDILKENSKLDREQKRQKKVTIHDNWLF